MLNFIKPEWQAPSLIKAYTTCQSKPKVDYNLCVKNTKNLETTLNNRQKLENKWALKTQPAWLNQSHSNICITLPDDQNREADAAYTQSKNQPLVILTADCLPILIAHRKAKDIAAIHAGWKGIYSGIIENTMAKLQDSPNQYMVWFGPCICQKCYPVSDSFKENFLQRYPIAKPCFIEHQQWHFSLTQMSEEIFKSLGVHEIYHSHLCTFENQAFYSYRREHGDTGRIATFIWMEEHQ
jgi:YfiH family protein